MLNQRSLRPPLGEGAEGRRGCYNVIGASNDAPYISIKHIQRIKYLIRTYSLIDLFTSTYPSKYVFKLSTRSTFLNFCIAMFSNCLILSFEKPS